MNDIEVSSIDLVEGGNVFKQGHFLTLGYIPRDENGNAVDLSGKNITVALWERDGIAFESAATYSGGVLRFTLNETVPAGNYQIEFTATSSTDTKYRKKFPTNYNSGRISVQQSADDAGNLGISVYTVAQIKSEQQAAQVAYQEVIDPKITTLTKRVDDGVGAFTEDTEIIDARMGKTNLRQFNEGLTAQLADIAVQATTFGAKFDGVSDDAVAINEAILFAKNKGGGRVLLPKGTGIISSPIYLQDQVEVIGQGRDVTFIKPLFTEGEVITAQTQHRQKAKVSDITIKPAVYQYKLIGISYKYLQYAVIERVDVFNCGVSFDFNGQYGCYYNKQYQTRAISTGIGIRLSTTAGSTQRPNSNIIEDVTILSPIVGVEVTSGNTNKFYDIKVESLQSIVAHPTVYPDGTIKGKEDRWFLKVLTGISNYYEKFRAEFEGNLVSLRGYGSHLSDFYCNFNGAKGEYITIDEQYSNIYQTNDLDNVHLGWGFPVLTHEIYFRKARLGYVPQIPSQIQFTPRDYSGVPSPGKKRGYTQFSANGDIYVAVDDDVFKKVAWQDVPTLTSSGQLKYHTVMVDKAEETISSELTQNTSAYITGIKEGDTVVVTANKNIPSGLTVNPVYVNQTAGSATLVIRNTSGGNVTIPSIKWTFTLIKL